MAEKGTGIFEPIAVPGSSAGWGVILRDWEHARRDDVVPASSRA